MILAQPWFPARCADLKRAVPEVENLTMSAEPDPLCFTCGLAYDGRHFNRLNNGAVCPTCRERMLDSLPAPLPRRVKVEEEQQVGTGASAGVLHILRSVGPDESAAE